MRVALDLRFWIGGLDLFILRHFVDMDGIQCGVIIIALSC